ncbi:MAG: hypothetical protein Fur0037_11700 [Planctomycetota bacterium]
MSTVLAICFEKGAGRKTLDRCLSLLGFRGPGPDWRLHDEGLLTATVRGPMRPGTLQEIGRIPGVAWVLDRTPRASPRGSVEIGRGRRIGPPDFAVIAGPCSVESESQILKTAERVAEAGATALRGGAFKPRTSPYSFGGLGERGLELLALARERTGLPVVTEVLDPAHLEAVARHADVLQIGSRNMQNFPLLFLAGSRGAGRPVLLKRGLAATLEEFRLAAEYVRLGQIAAGGDGRAVILCERGLRTFEHEVRYGLDVAAIPILQETTDLPVIADPSHAAGTARYVAPLALSAVAAGADGLLVEVHADPPAAFSDREQALDPDEFHGLMKAARAVAAARAAAGTGEPANRCGNETAGVRP